MSHHDDTKAASESSTKPSLSLRRETLRTMGLRTGIKTGGLAGVVSGVSGTIVETTCTGYGTNGGCATSRI